MIKAIVTGIEGATSSLSFVKDTLFPYLRERLPDFVRKYADNANIRALLEDIRITAGQSTINIDRLIRQLLDWLDQDKKITSLTTLQHLIWQAGYQTGDLRGHVYNDVAQMLRYWHELGISAYVYSSIPGTAQRLLFTYSTAGNLTSLFSGYFDMHIGAKQFTGSYISISKHINIAPSKLLYLSKRAAELDAAHAAGWNTIQLMRPGAARRSRTHTAVGDFTQIDLERWQAAELDGVNG